MPATAAKADRDLRYLDSVTAGSEPMGQLMEGEAGSQQHCDGRGGGDIGSRLPPGCCGWQRQRRNQRGERRQDVTAGREPDSDAANSRPVLPLAVVSLVLSRCSTRRVSHSHSRSAVPCPFLYGVFSPIHSYLPDCGMSLHAVREDPRLACLVPATFET